MLQVMVSQRDGHDLATTMQTVTGIQKNRKNLIPGEKKMLRNTQKYKRT